MITKVVNNMYDINVLLEQIKELYKNSKQRRYHVRCKILKQSF